jgi:hypothetical protein
MPSTTAFTLQGRLSLFRGQSDFRTSGGSTFKLALYTATASHGASTGFYTATNESAVSGGSGTGYTAGGATLTRIDPTIDSSQVIADFADVTFTLGGDDPALAAESCMIYNDSVTDPTPDPSISIHAFGGSNITASGVGATFELVFPAAASGTAILRLA